MPSKIRIHPPGVPLHFVQRGHNRVSCFVDVDDFRAYLAWLDEALRRWEVHLHAFVLMSNHVHMLLTPKHPDSVAGMMMSVGRRYVQFVNRKYQRTGTLWEGRYKASVIDDEAYLFACYRYIELNPVRAGIVRRPEEYVWSSYRANALGQADPMITPRNEYLALGRERTERLLAYQDLVRGALGDDIMADIRRASRRNRRLGMTMSSTLGQDLTQGRGPDPGSRT